MITLGRGRPTGLALIMVTVALGLAPSAVSAQAPAPPGQLSANGRENFARFLKADAHKGFALGPMDFFGWTSGRDTAFNAMLSAIWRCNRGALAPCRAYMVDDTVVEPLYAQFQADSESAMVKVRAASLNWPSYAEEDVDFRLPQTNEIRKGNYHAETPRTIEGAKTITTKELVALLNSPSPRVLIDVLDDNENHRTLPTAWWWRAAGHYANEQDSQLNALLRALLATAVPSRDTPLVFFCVSSRCWLSHNAALRAVAGGYTNVLWYRGGTEAWKAADLPLVKAVVTAQLW
jgi:PQQ-dependent catabolism-associated CXXCW motif protein